MIEPFSNVSDTELLAVEEFAQLLHEAGREAVERSLILNAPDPPLRFIEWDDLPEPAKEGRRIQARFLLRHHGAVRRLLP